VTRVARVPPGPARSVRAVARIEAATGAGGATVLPVLTGEGSLAPRRTPVRGEPLSAGVTVVGAMGGPLGGDRLRVEAGVGPGARLVVGTAAATVALPGPDGEEAAYDVRLTVRDGGSLDWLPQPLIAARGSVLRTTTRVELAPTARLLLREEQILGRHAEEPGRVLSRLTVHRAGRPLLDQALSYGPGVPGTAGTLGGHRAVGQILWADPAFERAPAAARTWTNDGAPAALVPLAGPAVLITALAPDGLRLRRALDGALDAVLDRPPDHVLDRTRAVPAYDHAYDHAPAVPGAITERTAAS
jgi:urease accessory protein